MGGIQGGYAEDYAELRMMEAMANGEGFLV